MYVPIFLTWSEICFVCDVYYQFFEFSDLAASAMPDDRAIMTYVSSYYHTFAGAQKVCILTNYTYLLHNILFF